MNTINIDEKKLSFLDTKEIERIRLNLKLIHPEVKNILISSTVEGEGKSSIALALGMSMANSGEKVLYVCSEYLGIFADNGGKTGKHGSNLENLDILIESGYNQLKEVGTYDYVIVDTKSLSVSNESIIYADSCDMVLLVVEANRVNYKKIIESKKLLTFGKCRNIEVILNKTHRTYGIFRYKAKRLRK